MDPEQHPYPLLQEGEKVAKTSKNKNKNKNKKTKNKTKNIWVIFVAA